MMSTQGRQSAGTAQEEPVTICQGAAEEEAEEGVGEWMSGIAERVQAKAFGGTALPRSCSQCQTSYSYSPLSLSLSLRVHLVIIFAIECQAHPGFFARQAVLGFFY